MKMLTTLIAIAFAVTLGACASRETRTTTMDQTSTTTTGYSK